MRTGALTMLRAERTVLCPYLKPVWIHIPLVEPPYALRCVTERLTRPRA